MSDVLLHAIVLADGPSADRKIAGLTLRERARRVAVKVGAVRVFVVDRPEDRAAITAWWADGLGGDLLVIRAGDQLVHTPLVSDLVGQAHAVSVTPAAVPAGAMIGRAGHADGLARALAAGDDDLALAATWLADGATAVEHGAVARHAVTTRAEQRAATRYLFQIIHKPQDNWLTRYLFRPVSRALTHVAVRTPITPNQVTYVTAILVALGVWFTVDGERDHAVLGAALILGASYVDCVDGEIARLKLMSSKLGGWLDTIVDELSTVAQLAALGWHCHLWWDRANDSHLALAVDGWVIALGLGVVASLVSIYCVYYNIIVLIGSSNSQDYVARFELVPGDAPRTVRMVPVPPTRPRHVVLRWLGTVLPHVVRRDFVCWAIVGLAALELTHVAFAAIVVGSVVTCMVLCLDHVRIRRQRREVERAGQLLVA
jgi:phosphatidylglycerophosphate synthase